MDSKKFKELQDKVRSGEITRKEYYQSAFGVESSDQLNSLLIFEGTAERAKFDLWKVLDSWTLNEAVHLMVGVEPVYYIDEAFDSFNPHFRESALPPQFFEMRATYIKAEKALIAGSLEGKKGDLKPKVFLEWASENGISIPSPLRDIAQGGTESPKSLLPCPIGTEWKEITITLIDDDTVKIRTPNGERFFTYQELRMQDDRTYDKTIVLWTLFKAFAENHGLVTSQNSNFNRRLPDTAKRLNKHLQNIFGISDSIYQGHYKQIKGYKTKINFSDRTKVISSD